MIGILAHVPIDRETPWHWRDGGEPLEMSHIILQAIVERPDGGALTPAIVRDLQLGGLIGDAAGLTARGQAIRAAWLARTEAQA
ncbi:MAG: hypothetical protein U5M50_10535 [Sphingobium sp.]|nr:hypothetical protein [Sphingobium sp.]